jgi:hypothetical protein
LGDGGDPPNAAVPISISHQQQHERERTNTRSESENASYQHLLDKKETSTAPDKRSVLANIVDTLSTRSLPSRTDYRRHSKSDKKNTKKSSKKSRTKKPKELTDL